MWEIFSPFNQSFNWNNQRLVNNSIASCNPTLIEMTCFRSQQRSNCAVSNQFITFFGVLCKNHGVDAKFTQAFSDFEFTISELASRYHWWIDLLHQKVRPQFDVFSSQQQLLFQFFIKEVIPATFLLRFKDKHRRVFQSFLYLQVRFCAFSILFKGPYTFEQMFYCLGSFFALSDLLQQNFV